ncbi:hypothetical protein M9H77_07974 [Catharanthus roseus]|uniref:Uncharacterized protein n=1 Tax=Catharanthus roseus TaxID=4058 RepID=A0ACC0BWR9_CATRO|nr:hypothetical protein M9H77_07974 [Catharanthus roseus]
MLQEVDDMTTRVLEGPPPSLTQHASVMRRVQTIICRCMISIGGTLGCTPSQHYIQRTFIVQPLRRRPWEPVLERDARGVKRSAVDCLVVGPMEDLSLYIRVGEDMQTQDMEERKVDDLEDGDMEIQGFDVPGDPFDSPDLDAPTFSLGLMPLAQSHPSGSGTSYVPPRVQEIHHMHIYLRCAIGCSFEAPPLLSTTDSSVPHMPISCASSSNSDEHDDEPTNDVIPAQQLGFGHRIDSRKQIDDLIESDTIRLLDWNDAMSDVQLGMRFIDKIQTPSVIALLILEKFDGIDSLQEKQPFFSLQGQGIQKLRLASRSLLAVSDFLSCSERQIFHYVCRDNGARPDTYVSDIYSWETYRRTYQSNFYPFGHKNFWRDDPYNLAFYPSNMNNQRGRKQGTRLRGKIDYPNPDFPLRCSRCRMPEHNRKNYNNLSSSNV